MLKKAKKNKYGRPIDCEIDLHGLTKDEAMDELMDFFQFCKEKNYRYVRVVTGKGIHSPNGVGVLNEMVRDYLRGKLYKFSSAKINEGGDGVFMIEL
ncbi:MAG: Smr/MutS family protein [Candidatus Falkowbacteria bacterium]